MTKRGGYQATAAGAFGAVGDEPLTAEECALCGGTGEVETLDRQEAACPVCVTREKDATITALRAEVADVRRGALLEAAEVLEAESKRIAAEADPLDRSHPHWRGRYDRACGVQDAAALLRTRAALFPIPPAAPQAAGGWVPVSERLPEEREDVLCLLDGTQVVVGWLSDDGAAWHAPGGMLPLNAVEAWQPLPPLPEPQAAGSEEQTP